MHNVTKQPQSVKSATCRVGWISVMRGDPPWALCWEGEPAPVRRCVTLKRMRCLAGALFVAGRWFP